MERPQVYKRSPYFSHFTDGISEAMTRNEEEWGEDRMVAPAQQLLTQKLLDCILAAAVSVSPCT